MNFTIIFQFQLTCDTSWAKNEDMLLLNFIMHAYLSLVCPALPQLWSCGGRNECGGATVHNLKLQNSLEAHK